jgi:quinol monooxygenase YgiN
MTKDKLIEFLRWDAEEARGEPGNVRFDVWEVDEEVYLYEAYSDEAGFARHKEGAAYKKWEKEIEPNLTVDSIVPWRQSTLSSADA